MLYIAAQLALCLKPAVEMLSPGKTDVVKHHMLRTYGVGLCDITKGRFSERSLSEKCIRLKKAAEVKANDTHFKTLSALQPSL